MVFGTSRRLDGGGRLRKFGGVECPKRSKWCTSRLQPNSQKTIQAGDKHSQNSSKNRETPSKATIQVIKDRFHQ